MSESAWHLAVDRETAKQLFGRKNLDAVQQFVWGLVQEFSHADADKILEQPPGWLFIENCLRSPSSLVSECSPLTQIFQGGRPLVTADAFSVFFVRPDMVPIIATEMSTAEEGQLRTAFASTNQDGASQPMEPLLDQWKSTRKFFQQAGERCDAVVFTIVGGA